MEKCKWGREIILENLFWEGEVEVSSRIINATPLPLTLFCCDPFLKTAINRDVSSVNVDDMDKKNVK